MTAPCYIGVGVGPGDPELLTLKAIKAIGQCGLLVYPANLDGHSMARDIAAQHISAAIPEHPIKMDFSSDRAHANAAYDSAARAIADSLDQGRDVAILCLGDPLFYGSFIYLHQRLQDRYQARVIPGITAASAASALVSLPLTLQRESYCVVPAPHNGQTEERLRTALAEQDCVVIMKAGKRRQQIIQLITESGRGDEAVYIEQAGLPEQQTCTDIHSLDSRPGSYFSVFIVSKHHP